MFRRVNEGIKEIDDRLDVTGVGAPAIEREEFVCECSAIDCLAPVPMSREEYEQARTDPTYFLVLPEHVDPAIEQVVAEGQRFCMVEKRPGVDDIARATDPRS